MALTPQLPKKNSATEGWDLPFDKNVDAANVRGVVIQNDVSNDTTVQVTRDTSNNMTFQDGVVSGVKTLTQLLAGGGGGATVTQVEIDTGSLPRFSGKVTVADAGISAGSKISLCQAGDALTGKGTLADENEMDDISWKPTVTGAGSMDVYFTSASPILGKFKLNYIIG